MKKYRATFYLSMDFRAKAPKLSIIIDAECWEDALSIASKVATAQKWRLLKVDEIA
jgi:hypothetical protein